VSTPTDYPDHQQSTVHVATDTILGTPLSGFSLATGATKTVYSGPIQQTSYRLLAAAFNANGATSDNPFMKHALIWKDAQGGNTLDIEHWDQVQTNVSPAIDNALVTGRGPTKAGFLTWLVKNEDPANAVTVDAELLQSSRVVTRPDWRSVSNNYSGSYTGAWTTLGGVSTPVSDPPKLILGCSPGITLAALAIANRLHAIFAGQAQININNGGAPLIVNFLSVNPEFSTILQQTDQIVLGANANVERANISLDRGPLFIEFANNSNVNATTFTYSMIAQEFAS
jgi:hypothetical protein